MAHIGKTSNRGNNGIDRRSQINVLLFNEFECAYILQTIGIGGFKKKNYTTEHFSGYPPRTHCVVIPHILFIY